MCDVKIQTYTLQGIEQAIALFESNAGISSDEFERRFRRGDLDTMAGNVWAALLRERNRLHGLSTEGDETIVTSVKSLVA